MATRHAAIRAAEELDDVWESATRIRDAAPTLVDEPWFEGAEGREVQATQSPVSEAPHDSSGPRTWLGRYELLLPVTLGGAKCTWLARQHNERGFTKLVGLVAVPTHSAKYVHCSEMLAEDARNAAALRHPNVCEILELEEHDASLYVATEWVHGASLAEILRPAAGPARPLPYAIAAHVVARACAGVHAAHELGADEDRAGSVLHRHLSVHNVLVSAIGIVKVAGFGTARAVAQLEALYSVEHTRMYPADVRLACMAPEVVAGGSFDRRSDVFSLGALLYEASTGRAAFGGVNAHASMDALLRGEYLRPSELIPSFPGELEAIIVRALERDPLRRFPTAEAMRAALDEWLARVGTRVDTTQVTELVNERAGALIGARGNVVRELAAGTSASGVRPIAIPPKVPELLVAAPPPSSRTATGSVDLYDLYMVEVARQRQRAVRWGVILGVALIAALAGFLGASAMREAVDLRAAPAAEIAPAHAGRAPGAAAIEIKVE